MVSIERTAKEHGRVGVVGLLGRSFRVTRPSDPSFGTEGETNCVENGLPLSGDVLANEDVLCEGNDPYLSEPISGWQGKVKRALDVAIAAIALVLLAPLMIAAAIAIKWETPGPVLFRQLRNGKGNKEISVYKFRSMKVLENGDKIQQVRPGDARVTRVGQFLRRTSIDELPQLFNILTGDMSIVGPRPHACAHNKYYGDLIEGYSARHQVRPGMTGWAQVHGLRGPTEPIELMKKRVDYDLEYISNWSLLLDFKIILFTPVALLFDRNAL